MLKNLRVLSELGQLSGKCKLSAASLHCKLHTSSRLANGKPEKLYFGKFTQKEYDEAAEIVKQQVENLEKQIKGANDPRSMLGKIPTIPSSPSSMENSSKSIESLSDILIQSIRTTGPLSLSAYMRQCLTHPEFGYYTTRDPLDTSSGDFITSPEISLVFGEMIGLWLYSIWYTQGKPSSVQLIEFGPGRGTLMHDVLQSFYKLSKNQVSIGITMIEASPVLRGEQWKKLCKQSEPKPLEFTESTTKWGNLLKWVDTERDIENDPLVPNYLIAHEFFDALPIKSFEKQSDNSWRELLVEHSSSVNNTQPKIEGTVETHEPSSADINATDFHLTTAPKETPAAFIPKNNPRFKSAPTGTRIEICPDAELFINKIADLVQSSNTGAGGALVIDYGISQGVPDNTLRGIYKHKFVSPFFKPGDVDLSIDVDFENLKIISSPKCKVYGAVDQGDWLHEIGIGHRIDQLIKSTDNHEEQDKIYDSYLRLTGKDDKSMGKVYKFMALLPNDTKEPPIGFLNL